ncbi:unnamed protein product [Rhodiola kirilowii]
MEEVEGANRAAVESCDKVLNLLSQLPECSRGFGEKKSDGGNWRGCREV